ncbi:MAG TPA: AAA family ATPase [bacterium]|nr:AAA family ATPase [bacterium]HPS30589.1 AAA family ATPase [bacterium]
MVSAMKKELKHEMLRYYPELKKYEGMTTLDIKPASQFVFQKRGFESLDFGISINKKGFNIYVAGDAGTGKTSNVKKHIEEIALKMKTPDDMLYVYNFKNPDMPKLLYLPAGKGEKLVNDMEDLLDYFIFQIPRQMESESFEIKKSEVVRWYQDESQVNFSDIEKEATKLSFMLKATQNGLVINPVVKGKTIDREHFETLSEAQKEVIKKNEEALQEKLIAYFHKERGLEKEYKEKMTTLRQTMIRLIISEPLRELKKKHPQNEGFGNHLEDLAEHIVNNFDEFFVYRDIEEGKVDPTKYPTPDFKEFKINLLINNKDIKGAPVVYETNPTFQTIMGYFEYEEIHNSLFTDFTKLKPGALHKANGGFLILQANDILKNYYAWTALKRSIRNRSLQMTDVDIDFKYRVNISPDPEPVTLDVKVILIGEDYIYHLLYDRDPDFRRIFRIKADFDSTISISQSTTDALVGFISRVVNEDCHIPFELSAIKRLLHYCSRQSEDQKKYRIHASDLVEVIVESVYWAKKKNKKTVDGTLVKIAIDSREERHARFKEHYYESIQRGKILIDAEGEKTGQINGLAVYSIGDFSFGIPSRITAKVFSGRRGIINIEREARLSGSIHDKGAMILAGYLGNIFAQNKQLAISASIAFEQSYGGVDGDSASSTELYAMLSALADLPIKQSIAVTGSINQNGDIQPIGGVNEKIEGFFEICRIKGLTGSQGVIIPIQNVENLNLNDDVVEAVKKGKFHIYAVKNILEGIEILTGVPAGKQNKDGSFTKGSVFDLVDKKIAKLSEVK